MVGARGRTTDLLLKKDESGLSVASTVVFSNLEVVQVDGESSMVILARNGDLGDAGAFRAS